MAIDNTPPRLRLIVTIAIIMLITLVSLDFVFKSYYAFMTDVAKHEKLAPTLAKTEQRAAEQAALAGAKLPIEQAMAQVGKGTRSALIEPRPSDDMAPMTGWAKMPKQAPAPVPADPHPTPSPGLTAPGLTPSPGDGGAMDAGATPPVAPKDAGARGPAPAPTPAHPNH